MLRFTKYNISATRGDGWHLKNTLLYVTMYFTEATTLRQELRQMSGKRVRKRGDAVVIRHGKVLLVKDKGTHLWSLPGGGVHKGERSYQAPVREL